MKLIQNYKGLIAKILLGIYVMCAFKFLIPVIGYEVNYTYISTVLCENKNKPSKKCNGKCYLKKQLKKTAEQESKSSLTIKLIAEVISTNEVLYTALQTDLSYTITYSIPVESNYKVYSQYTSPPPRV